MQPKISSTNDFDSIESADPQIFTLPNEKVKHYYSYDVQISLKFQSCTQNLYLCIYNIKNCIFRLNESFLATLRY